MELPTVEDLLPSEANAEVEFHPNDHPMLYPLYWSNHPRFVQKLFFARVLAPSVRNVVHMNHFTGGIDSTIPFSNWEEDWNGYREWASPEDTTFDDDDAMTQCKMNHVIATQHLYAGGSGLLPGCIDKPHPEIQVKQMFAAPIVRALKKFEDTEIYHELANNLFVLLIELLPVHTSSKIDRYDKIADKNAPRVWRVLTCFGDTTLDSFHDQVLGPAMGWRRHHHSYKFIVPTSGATFGPKRSDAVDTMHRLAQKTFFLDSEKYDVRHVLRRATQQLIYVYDLGDFWKHQITLIGLVNRGDTITTDYFHRYPHVTAAMVKGERQSWTLAGGDLLAGEINCPPEDSEGCDRMGQYDTLLSKGSDFYVSGERGINWKEHGIFNAFDFDLKAHRKRFKKAVKGRKNPQDGVLKSVIPMKAGETVEDLIGNPLVAIVQNTKNRTIKVEGTMVETVGKCGETGSKKCANCGKQKHSNSNLILRKCSRCNAVKYCSRSCQVEHWNLGHKEECNSLNS